MDAGKLEDELEAYGRSMQVPVSPTAVVEVRGLLVPVTWLPEWVMPKLRGPYRVASTTLPVYRVKPD